MTHSVLSVANTFLALGRRDGVPISNMKLQKLLYFAQGHSFGMRNRPLMNELPEAWQYGPVFPSAYHAFKHFGAGEITGPGFGYDFTTMSTRIEPEVLAEDDRAFIEAVWNAYKDRSPLQLMDLSHAPEGPWQKAYGQYRNADISIDELTRYFGPKAG